MNKFDVIGKVSTTDSFSVTLLTLKQSFFIVNISYVFLQITDTNKGLWTNFTFERPNSFVNKLDMTNKFSSLANLFVTKMTLKLSFHFMNVSSMLIQISNTSIGPWTGTTFVRFQFIMNIQYVLFKFVFISMGTVAYITYIWFELVVVKFQMEN